MYHKRILAGGIMQESHSFNPINAERGVFQINAGPEWLEKVRGTNSILGGIVDAAAERGYDSIIPVMFQAQSGGLVRDAVFREVVDTLVSAAKQGGFDAIVLALHGGMLTETLDDPEGLLFSELRMVVGPDIPIAAAFDLHAHVTARTLTDCDFLTAYKTNPHADPGPSGRRALNGALDIVEGTLDPVCAVVHFPMLTLGNDRTDEPGPLADLHAYAASLIEAETVRDVSIFNAQQFLDVPDLGQTILAYTDGDEATATRVAKDVAERLWAARDALVGTYPSLEDCLARAEAMSGPGTLVLGDQGDRVAAGGPGDSTHIAQVLVKDHPSLPSVVPITDADAVAECIAVGNGGEVTLTVGGTYSTVSPPLTVTGTVLSCGGEADVVVKGPHDRGRRTTTGPFAVLKVDGLHLVLTERANAYLDPRYYEAMDLDLGAMRVVVTRSGYHFSLNFADHGECITIDTPGMTSYRITELPFVRARPFYPMDKIDYTPDTAVRRRKA